MLIIDFLESFKTFKVAKISNKEINNNYNNNNDIHAFPTFSYYVEWDRRKKSYLPLPIKKKRPLRRRYTTTGNDDNNARSWCKRVGFFSAFLTSNLGGSRGSSWGDPKNMTLFVTNLNRFNT